MTTRLRTRVERGWTGCQELLQTEPLTTFGNAGRSCAYKLVCAVLRLRSFISLSLSSVSQTPDLRHPFAHATQEPRSALLDIILSTSSLLLHSVKMSPTAKTCRKRRRLLSAGEEKKRPRKRRTPFSDPISDDFANLDVVIPNSQDSVLSQVQQGWPRQTRPSCRVVYVVKREHLLSTREQISRVKNDSCTVTVSVDFEQVLAVANDETGLGNPELECFVVVDGGSENFSMIREAMRHAATAWEWLERKQSNKDGSGSRLRIVVIRHEDLLNTDPDDVTGEGIRERCIGLHVSPGGVKAIAL